MAEYTLKKLDVQSFVPIALEQNWTSFAPIFHLTLFFATKNFISIKNKVFIQRQDYDIENKKKLGPSILLMK